MKTNSVNIENVLYENIILPYSALGLGEYNNTHYFMLPLFEIRRIPVFRNNYIGTYINDYGRDCNIENQIHVVFRFPSFENDAFKRVNSYFENHERFKFTYYAGHNEGDLVTFVLKAKPEESDCYNKIVNGEYSKVPDWYIGKCAVFNFNYDTRRRLQAICRKAPWHKREMELILGVDLDNSELWEKFDGAKEIFRYERRKTV